jgi:prophage antirepressor-like protein
LDLPNRGLSIVNESGLYAVILRSDKPNAKAFRKWVTSEVLPSIRKHGAYILDGVLDKMRESEDFAESLIQRLMKEKERNSVLTSFAGNALPKVHYHALIGAR